MRLAMILIIPLVAMVARVAACPPDEFGTDGYWVSSYGSQEILRFAQDGTFLGATPVTGLSGPRGITVMPSGEVFVASQNSDQVLRLDTNGALLGSMTISGLDAPTGATVGPNGDYYVCSFNTDSVLRVTGSGTVVETYTSPGLNGPNCIVFQPSGEFFVTGQFSNDVHRFSSAGLPVDSFSTGQLSVMGAALDMQGRLLVAAGSSDDVKVFDCDGNLLDTWDVDGGPQSIAVREDGRIYVTTFFTDRVVEIDANGNEVESWTGGNTLRGIEFFPAPVPTFVRGDANMDGAVNLQDPIRVLQGLFSGGELTCPDAADTNDDGAVDLSDVVDVLAYLFSAGTSPPQPSPGSPAGTDPTTDGFGCLN